MRYSTAKVKSPRPGEFPPGGSKPFPSLENPCSQPPGDHPLRGESAKHSEEVLVTDLVECAGQIGIQNPGPRGLSLKGGKQGFYRVVAAAARPEPIRTGLKTGLPLGPQRIFHPCVMAAVNQQRDPNSP